MAIQVHFKKNKMDCHTDLRRFAMTVEINPVFESACRSGVQLEFMSFKKNGLLKVLFPAGVACC